MFLLNCPLTSFIQDNLAANRRSLFLSSIKLHLHSVLSDWSCFGLVLSIATAQLESRASEASGCLRLHLPVNRMLACHRSLHFREGRGLKH